MVIPVVGSRFRSNQYPIPERMKAWVLGGPEELSLIEKPVPEPGRAEVLVRIDAIAVCATDIEIIRHGVPAMIDGELPFNRGFTPGHEYMGTIVKLGPTVDEFQVGDRVTVEVHAGCGRCQRCREGMYTSCLNYGYRAKGPPGKRLQHRWRLCRIRCQQHQYPRSYP
jgi:L-iditol 2-dehydrogenase